MHIVYFSPTGGTRKAAYIIGKEIDPQATEIDITDHTRQQNSYELNGEDTLLVAVPVYGGRVPSVAIDRLKRITGHNTPAILVVVYGNRDYDDALLELLDKSPTYNRDPQFAARLAINSKSGQNNESAPSAPQSSANTNTAGTAEGTIRF